MWSFSKAGLRNISKRHHRGLGRKILHIVVQWNVSKSANPVREGSKEATKTIQRILKSPNVGIDVKDSEILGVHPPCRSGRVLPIDKEDPFSKEY
jgi:hypothetical protein